MEWLKRWSGWCRRGRAEPVPQDDPEREPDHLETEEERKKRWTSIRVIYFTMFLMSLGFSIILTGVWPYLDKLDPTAGKEFMGLVVAANPLGQMLFSPLVGWWANRVGSIRAPLLATIALFVVSSGAYSSLHLFTSNVKYWMWWARFLVGASSANIAASRSYLSAATRLKERTSAVSMMSLAQVLGFAVGPGLQAAVTPLGKQGLELGPLRLDMYTAAGWLNVLLGIANFSFFLPCVFKESKIAAKEAMVFQGKQTEREAWKAMRPDYVSSWTLIGAFFVLGFNFVLLETLATSLTMDQFAWTEQQALRNMGIMMSAGAVAACATFAAIGPLSRLVEERRLLLWGGFLLTGLGSALCLPWGATPARPAPWPGAPGCPAAQAWCRTAPGLTLTQFLLAYACVTVGYPLGLTLIQTIFSKILGPRPQGVWQGLLTGSGCLSRVMGPVVVSYVYSRRGPVWTFASTSVLMLCSMIWIRLVFPRLRPPPLAPPDTPLSPLTLAALTPIAPLAEVELPIGEDAPLTPDYRRIALTNESERKEEQS